jgi:Rrf2 family iron-sulfur cluster assembly transcriptional regulator
MISSAARGGGAVGRVRGAIMKITATEEYGLRCMLQLALHPGDTVSLSELARAENIAPPFAAKVLLRLRRAGLVVASRGRKGGYQLAAPAEAITVLSVLSALGRPLFDAAFCSEHGAPDDSACSRLTDCSLRPVWAHLDAMLRGFFSQTTLADLVRGERSTERQLAQRWPLIVTPARSATPPQRRSS